MSDYDIEDYRDYPELWDDTHAQETYEGRLYAEFDDEDYPHESELVDA